MNPARISMFLVVALGFVASFALPGCRETQPPRHSGPLRVIVTVAPLKGLVEPLLPPGSEIEILMQPGRSEHGYEFSPSDASRLSRADLVVYIGLGLEGKLTSMLDKQQRTDREVVCVAEVLGIKSDDHHAHDDHDHDEAGHSHAVDPHLWLDPSLMADLIPRLLPPVERAAADAGITTSKTAFTEAGEKLVQRIRAVDEEWRTMLLPLQGAAVVTHHNAFARPAARYGFKVAAVIREFESSEPTAADLAKVVDAIRNQHVSVIFMEPQFNPGVAEKLRAMSGVKLATLDPIGDGDWFALMDRNLAALAGNLAPMAPAEAPH